MSFGWVTLVATPKSHPFDERRIKVSNQNEPVKIGRAVARTQATHENAVFDCKVLSRNHAILWYRDGEFWLKDTKSSNGTFVNNEKLQTLGNGRDTDTKRVYTGDIIQLGVEIVENANKVVYGCIYAVIQCYNADFKLLESIGMVESEGTSNNTLVNNRKLFQMQQYISEATHREKQREEKISELMSIILANEQASETAWKALVNEDRLLARIEALEAQLSVLGNNNNPDKQKEELLQMIDEKTKFEALTKDKIRKLVEEGEETASRLKDMERSLETTDQTCRQLRIKNDDLETALAETTEMFDQKNFEAEQLATELAETKRILVVCEEKFADVLQKNMKLGKAAVINETASGLARLLANAVNSGSFIEAPELALLINTLKQAQYLPPHSRESSSTENSSASESELRTQLINGFHNSSEPETKPQEEKTVESYLKTILELQAKNRDLEMQLEKENLDQSYDGSQKEFEIEGLKEMLSEMPLALSPSENVAYFPEASTSDSFASNTTGPLMQKQQTVIRKPDQMETLLLLASLVPLLALFLSMLAPIQKRLTSSAHPTQPVKKEE